MLLTKMNQFARCWQMAATAPPSGAAAQGHCRRAFALPRMVVALSFIGSLGFAAFRFVSGSSWASHAETPLLTPVVAGKFVHEVVERGNIESSSNVEVRCEVQSRGTPGTTILEIAAEGTYVKPGDFLVRLDDSNLKTELLQQQIACNNSHALVVQARSDLEAAQLALREYESGTFKQQQEELESALFVAEENVRRAEEYLRYSERLATRGYVTEIQLEADRFGVEKARKELDGARTKLTVLGTYTKLKTLNKMKADVVTAEAKLASLEESYKLDLTRLAQIKTQIAKCVVVAPTSGQVVYANENRTSTGDLPIQEGRLVRERQLMIRLPDPRRMQVLARINESRIDLITVGMPTKITLDALPDKTLKGVVRTVSEYPLPSLNPYMAHIKEYATVVEIQRPPEALRPGMTAEVAIQVEQRDNALQVPVQSVFEHDSRHYCLVHGTSGELEARDVTIGSSNEKFVVVQQGLNPDEHVVLYPQNYEDKVEFPLGAGSKSEEKPRTEPVTVASQPVATAANARASAAQLRTVVAAGAGK